MSKLYTLFARGVLGATALNLILTELSGITLFSHQPQPAGPKVVDALSIKRPFFKTMRPLQDQEIADEISRMLNVWSQGHLVVTDSLMDKAREACEVKKLSDCSNRGVLNMLHKILKHNYNSGSTSAQLYGYSLEHYGLNLPELMQAQYEILGVIPGATKDKINTAHRKLALKHHPDRPRPSGCYENDVELKSKTDRRFLEIQEAFEALKTDIWL